MGIAVKIRLIFTAKTTDVAEDMAQNAKQSRRKGRTTGQKKGQRTSQKKAASVSVLRPKPKKRTKVKYGRVLMLGLVIYFIIWAVYPATFRVKQGRELDKLKKQLGYIDKQNTDIQKEVDYLNSDEYVEQRARSLGLSKADEEVIVVIPPDSKDSRDTKSPKNPDKPLKKEENKAEKKDENKPSASLWDRITGFFSSRF